MSSNDENDKLTRANERERAEELTRQLDLLTAETDDEKSGPSNDDVLKVVTDYVRGLPNADVVSARADLALMRAKDPGAGFDFRLAGYELAAGRVIEHAAKQVFAVDRLSDMHLAVEIFAKATNTYLSLHRAHRKTENTKRKRRKSVSVSQTVLVGQSAKAKTHCQQSSDGPRNNNDNESGLSAAANRTLLQRKALAPASSRARLRIPATAVPVKNFAKRTQNLQ
jgi:hypothetical protein